MTQQMLMYRAASFWTSAYAPELSMGMKTEDELRDIIDTTYEDVTDKSESKKQENANKKEISIPEEKPNQQEEPAQTQSSKAVKLDALTVKTLDEAKEFLTSNFGIAPESMKTDSDIREVAKESGFEIIIEKPKGPDF